ncbi:MAG: hypothetical protein V3R85_10160, partial [Alphaproteobacteria bacterium]
NQESVHPKQPNVDKSGEKMFGNWGKTVLYAQEMSLTARAPIEHAHDPDHHRDTRERMVPANQRGVSPEQSGPSFLHCEGRPTRRFHK